MLPPVMDRWFVILVGYYNQVTEAGNPPRTSDLHLLLSELQYAMYKYVSLWLCSFKTVNINEKAEIAAKIVKDLKCCDTLFKLLAVI